MPSPGHRSRSRRVTAVPDKRCSHASLPPLVAGSHRRVLPMADGSAAALAEWLAGARATSTADDAAGWPSCVCSGDPPLLLWVVCRAGQADFSCGSVADAARWLAEHALDALQWPAAQDASGRGIRRGGRLDPACGRGRGLVRFGRPAGRRQPGGPRRRDPGRPALRRGRLAPRSSSCRGRSSAWCRPATAPRRGRPGRGRSGRHRPPARRDIDLEAVRRRGAEAGQRWAAQLGGLADWLPRVAALPGAAGGVEDRFQETLQQEKLAALAEFAAGAGHEINNPLTVIAGRANCSSRRRPIPSARRRWR